MRVASRLFSPFFFLVFFAWLGGCDPSDPDAATDPDPDESAENVAVQDFAIDIGGDNACTRSDMGTDLDVGPDGVTPGWYFYINFTSGKVPYTLH